MEEHVGESLRNVCRISVGENMLRLSCVLEIVITELEMKLVILFPVMVRNDRFCSSFPLLLIVSSQRDRNEGHFLLLHHSQKQNWVFFFNLSFFIFGTVLKQKSLDVFILLSLLSILIKFAMYSLG
jgi:hypothetical protein